VPLAIASGIAYARRLSAAIIAIPVTFLATRHLLLGGQVPAQ